MKKSLPLFTYLPMAGGSHAKALTINAPDPVTVLRWLSLPLLALALILLSIDLAEAKRLGGNKSFGSKDSYSKSYDKPTPPNTSASNMQQSTPPQAKAPGGFLSKFGGMGGLVGGLLMGGLLGSLFFGGGFGGFGILEMVLLGVGGFLLFRFIRARRGAQAGGTTRVKQTAPGVHDRLAYADGPAGDVAPNLETRSWGTLRTIAASPGGANDTIPPVVMPAGLDEAEFLAGAKALYNRLQTSWDRRDLTDIRGFTSPEVYAEIAHQASEDPTPGKTDILMIEARVIEAGTEGTQTVISVLYDVLLRENQANDQPSQIREVWHISRDQSATKPEWILEGIQQLKR
ncbi:TIM44-like domain-containing protein [Desulfovibrio aerotolerans]|uniref:TIM44-like domain-containing protein n=1 Tax=Solidesulfovibrio aerotolerans TaxID=295255 RepID=A0A7C9IV58_9BACT|nr:TIM44-like domain-containing protein [Solidesulfovibrio aerotolerans]MYL84460.1 TIM44-like domain-containing protein [Solidesulfovibrio aerotolerans]